MYQKRIRYLLTLCAGGLIGLLSLAKVGYAQTVIDQGYLYQNAVWDAAHSPYILEDQVYVPIGKSLTIKPGTHIVASSSLDTVSAIYVEGSLFVQGESSNKVDIYGPSSITISLGKAYISYADISLSTGIGVYDGVLDIKNSIIDLASNAITTRASELNIDSSQIRNNNSGIVIQSNGSDIFPVMNNSLYGMGGMGNLFLAQSNRKTGSVIVKNSSITDNSNYSIRNLDSNTVLVRGNWWGSASGPVHGGTNKISGIADYEPWLVADPFLQGACCSSILFLPGLEASRLHLGTNQLWEPNRNADVEKLYLNTDGTSKDSSIYVGDPIGKAYGLKEIYGSFVDYLQSLKTTGTINDTRFFAYDWRQPISQVVSGRELIKVNNSLIQNQNLVDIVTSMASSSKTEKVTLIAHSNGGLVAKYLVKTLTDIGKDYLIDKVISVAVPYVGTPQAIAGLLHGDNQSIVGGVILSKSVARLLGQNMPSAYSLLPTESYFTKVFGPTIAFASTTIKGLNNNVYPKEITNYKDQTAFVLDSHNVRQNAKKKDTDIPIKGNIGLLDFAKSIHSVIDSYSWPISISKWAITGWNISTAKSVNYFDENNCVNKKCKPDPVYVLKYTKSGDGTVVTPSASYGASNVISLNLKSIEGAKDKELDHSNILTSSSTIVAIDRVVTNRNKTEKEILDEIAKIPGVTIGEIDFNREEPAYLRLSTHSPVDLHIYDSKGNHAGIIPVPPELDIEDGLITFVDNNIRGVRLDPGQGYTTRVVMDDDVDEKYDIVIKGNNFGTFSYQVERVRGDNILENIQYRDIPVTPFSVATTSITTRATDNKNNPKFTNMLPPLLVDVDGDGSRDITATPTTRVDSIEQIKYIRKIAKLYCKDPKRLAKIEKRLDKLEESFRKGNSDTLHDFYDKLLEKMGHVEPRKITEFDKNKVLDLVEIYISQFE